MAKKINVLKDFQSKMTNLTDDVDEQKLALQTHNVDDVLGTTLKMLDAIKVDIAKARVDIDSIVARYEHWVSQQE